MFALQSGTWRQLQWGQATHTAASRGAQRATARTRLGAHERRGEAAEAAARDANITRCVFSEAGPRGRDLLLAPAVGDGAKGGGAGGAWFCEARLRQLQELLART